MRIGPKLVNAYPNGSIWMLKYKSGNPEYTEEFSSYDIMPEKMLVKWLSAGGVLCEFVDNWGIIVERGKNEVINSIITEKLRDVF